jgi:kanamycin kinase
VSFAPVPRLLSQGADDTGSWLVTAALPGQSAVAERWKADPATAVTAVGAGLRAMHDAAPAAGCPRDTGGPGPDRHYRRLWDLGP